MHVMVDLETWGTRPGCALRSIGACVFDPKTGVIGQTFYRNISEASCLKMGLVKDPDTVEWWGKQGAMAQAALEPDQQSLSAALIDFTLWWTNVEGGLFYCHGANFDAPILEAAYAAVLLDPPWKFWNVRCSRTLLSIGDRSVKRDNAMPHHALEDAKAQAVAVAAVFRFGSMRPA